MAAPAKFHGWLGLDKDSVKGTMKWQTFEPKKWTESDVDIKVSHCGICGSDIHTLRSGKFMHTYIFIHSLVLVFLRVHIGS